MTNAIFLRISPELNRVQKNYLMVGNQLILGTFTIWWLYVNIIFKKHLADAHRTELIFLINVTLYFNLPSGCWKNPINL